MQKVYFYFDDSGVLHKNAPNKYFVYAGIFFQNLSEKDNFKRKYCDVNKQIRKHLSLEGELKASVIKEPKHKSSLYRVMKNENTVGLTVDINKVYDSILSNKKSIHRYKDYVLKRLIKTELQHQVDIGKINLEEDIKIMIYVDEQATATDGYYNLRDSVYEEVKKGIINFDYSSFHQPLFSGKVDVSVEYCDSKKNYLIQASDILANRIWASFMTDKPELRAIPNHRCLRLP